MKLKTKFEPAVDHNAAMIEELRADPAYAEIYLQTALDEIYEEGGVPAFLIALRQVIDVAELIAELARIEAASRTKPVGEVVAWGENIPPRQGIARKVDFRWLDYDVEPGTKLYAAPQLQTVSNPYTLPDGWVMVPIEPTEKMIVEGFESEPNANFSEPETWEAYQEMSGCQQAAHKAELCWAAMIAAVPQPDKCHK